MKQIGQLIQENRRPTTTRSVSLPQAIHTWQTKFPTSSDAERSYSPSAWTHAIANPSKAYTACCPTLYQYGTMFGQSAAARWIHIQVLALFGASSNSDRAMADGIPLFASSFAHEVAAFKLSELMLFFARYKAGKYDNSYSSFDTRRIGNAFFREFLPARQIELDRITKQEEQRRIESRRFTPPEGYTSLSWYEELKRRASQGDQKAILQLNPQTTL